MNNIINTNTNSTSINNYNNNFNYHMKALNLVGINVPLTGAYNITNTVALAQIVSTGGKQVLYNALMATLDPGDEVLLADPGYPANRQFVRVVEGVPRAGAQQG